MNLTIRQENKADIKQVYELNLLAFGEKGEATLVDVLRERNEFIPQLSLVAILDDEIVGHILFTKIKIVDNNGNEAESLALAPMAIIPKHQKKGIGGHLINKGIDIATKLNFKSVIVLGHENYYPKFGFIPTIKWDIKAPYEVPDNAFMGIELVKDGLKDIQGVVKYPKEFDEV